MNVSLVLVRPDGTQKEAKITRATTVIGRQTDCALQIPTAAVSRHHCEISVAGEAVSVRDLGSSNGTYVNQRRVNQTELSPGDLLAIGNLVFVVRIDGRPAEIEAEDCYEDGVVLPASGKGPATPTTRTVQGATIPKAKADPEGSSFGDLDFLDETDMKKQPRL
ncbi:MAG: FHA domain-containing protein [Phycisphaerales bacterium]|jgi:pSer/pThr/pTyr-binding forkhead associated (FHA) protein|nr:FHA domain-containing protein [Phycisphaerales bacterium]